MTEEPTNPYKDKATFHYAPLPVQIAMALEDAGFCHILDKEDTPTMGEDFNEHSMGKPFGLSDAAVYVIAFGSLLYALITTFMK